jgi:hypothetical protein
MEINALSEAVVFQEMARARSESRQHFLFRHLSWPKIPSVPLDSSDKRESEGRRLFLMKNAAGGLMQTARSR